MIREMMFQSEIAATLPKHEAAAVFFYAKWAPTCRLIHTAYEQLAAKHRNIAFFRVDIENCPEIVRALHLQGIPTFIFYRRGESIAKLEAADPDELALRVNELAARLA